jgi:histidine triad (HIT) family protein
MDDCIFCRIIARQAPAEIVYEDEATIVFMDINQGEPGHLLVVPKRHSRSIFDISQEDAAAVMRAAVKVASALRRAVNAAGLNLWQANEAVAGQTVFHFHLHLLPRQPGDSIRAGMSFRRADAQEIRETADRIRRELTNT